DVAVVREFRLTGQARRNGTLLSASRARMLQLLSRSAEGVCQPGAHLFGLCLLVIVFHLMGGACKDILPDDQGSARAGRRKPGSGGCLQRWLSPGAFSRPWSAGN